MFEPENVSGPDRSEEQLLYEAIRNINGKILGWVTGLLFGLVLFLATLWLTLKGGEDVGQHLSLLNQFFPGYSVSVLGSFVGLFYGFLTGYLAGWAIGWIYNSIVGRKHRNSRV